ncbi:hypothetical protein E2C01_022130 [Portunus trituberculatus]|uniref:Uncharacterized protein n=1 Tax=Portunus trituberculatus TaxID=210409 RepID=A0A5B7E6F6_PORTR|nr:hypothetical protein [Portunus trituberculatus]
MIRSYYKGLGVKCYALRDSMPRCHVDGPVCGPVLRPTEKCVIADHAPYRPWEANLKLIFERPLGAITLAYDTWNEEHLLQIAGTCTGLVEQSWDGFISIPVLRMLSQ